MDAINLKNVVDDSSLMEDDDAENSSPLESHDEEMAEQCKDEDIEDFIQTFHQRKRALLEELESCEKRRRVKFFRRFKRERMRLAGTRALLAREKGAGSGVGLEPNGADVEALPPISTTPSSSKDYTEVNDKPSPMQPLQADTEVKQREIWSNLANTLIPKMHRLRMLCVNVKQNHCVKLAHVCARESNRIRSRFTKSSRDLAAKAKKLNKEMLVFWKRNEKEDREGRKRAEKEASEKRKLEEDAREQRRQARKLNFLITQTELYSHFIGRQPAPLSAPVTITAPLQRHHPPDGVKLGEIDFDGINESDFHELARQKAQNALTTQQTQTKTFDEAMRARRLAGQMEIERAKLLRDENGRAATMPPSSPTSRNVESQKAAVIDNKHPSADQDNIAQPRMLTCQLKPYQLKGLNWIAHLYEQGINGILADDMYFMQLRFVLILSRGLGKTVQSISLMAWLAETQNIWGPFLVIAPASTLHNWQQEVTRFAPTLKTLPYWGSIKDRKTLRRFWTTNQLYTPEAPFHVLITSYQIIVADQQYFQRVKWQYLILDEAHAIKSSTTARWKVLMSFQCRNRLLLTGTPIQNTMHELWALLHFIMPTLFDNPEEFNDWFSKDIESHAAERGKLNDHQLKRLHMILKPFMLRRIKTDVENELGRKIEKTVLCRLTVRQQRMYDALSEKISIEDLLEKAQFESGGLEGAGNDSLMNAMMQFRKVCNHPQLFEVAEIQSPYFVGVPPQIASRLADAPALISSCANNPIRFSIPPLIYHAFLPNSPSNVRTILRV